MRMNDGSECEHWLDYWWVYFIAAVLLFVWTVTHHPIGMLIIATIAIVTFGIVRASVTFRSLLQKAAKIFNTNFVGRHSMIPAFAAFMVIVAIVLMDFAKADAERAAFQQKITKSCENAGMAANFRLAICVRKDGLMSVPPDL